jgi:hypothetical protein
MSLELFPIRTESFCGRGQTDQRSFYAGRDHLIPAMRIIAL